MARMGSKVLDVGDPFPELHCDTIDGGSIKIPYDKGHAYQVILIYRGHW